MLEIWRKIDPETFKLLVGEFGEGLLIAEEEDMNLKKED